MTIADMKAALKWQMGGITCGDGFHCSGNWYEIGGNALIMHVSFLNLWKKNCKKINLKEKSVGLETHCLMAVTANSFPTHMFLPAPQGRVWYLSLFPSL